MNPKANQIADQNPNAPSIDDQVFDFICSSLTKLKDNIKQHMAYLPNLDNEIEINQFLSKIDFSFTSINGFDPRFCLMDFTTYMERKWLELPTTIEIYLTNIGEIAINKNIIFIQCLKGESDIKFNTVLLDDDIKENTTVKLNFKIVNTEELKRIKEIKENIDLIFQAKYFHPESGQCVPVSEKVKISFVYSKIDVYINQLDKWFNVKNRFPLIVLKKEIKNSNFNYELCMNRLLNIEKTMVFEE